MPVATAEKKTVQHGSIALGINHGKVKIDNMVGVMTRKVCCIDILSVKDFLISIFVRDVVEAF